MARSSSIELSHLRYFVAAADHGSFRKAGTAIDVKESSISRRIRDLEDQLGASLFQRHNGGVSLTLAGQHFLHRARKALQQIDDGARDVGAIGRVERGKVKVGVFSSFASGFLADLLRAYDRKHTKVRIDFVDGAPAEHIAAIRQLRRDVAFLTGTRDWPDCETTYLWSERVFAVLPDTHHLIEKDELDWPDLAREAFIVSEGPPGPEIHNYLVQRLAELGHHPEIQPQYVGRDNLLAAVAVGRGLTVVSEAAVAVQMPGIAYRRIAHEQLPFSAVWSPRNDNPALRRLLSLARTMSKSIGQWLFVACGFLI